MECEISSQAQEHEQWNVGPDASGILQPLPDVQANDVENHRDRQHAERRCQRVSLTVRQPAVFGAANEHGHGNARAQQSREIKERIDPVSPAGNEAVEITKGFFTPHIESAFRGIASGKFDDDERRWQEEEECGEYPQADGRGAVVGGGSDPARAENSSDVEQQHVPKTHFAAKLGFWTGGFRLQTDSPWHPRIYHGEAKTLHQVTLVDYRA